MKVAIVHHPAPFVQDLSAWPVAPGRVRYWDDADITTLASREGGHTRTVLPHHSLRPSNVTSDGLRGVKGPWTVDETSVRCTTTGATR